MAFSLGEGRGERLVDCSAKAKVGKPKGSVKGGSLRRNRTFFFSDNGVGRLTLGKSSSLTVTPSR